MFVQDRNSIHCPLMMIIQYNLGNNRVRLRPHEPHYQKHREENTMLGGEVSIE
jgi:hypothetical protein